MRKVRPRTPELRFHPQPDMVVAFLPKAPPSPEPEEQRLRRELDDACRAVNAAVLRLSGLIDHRENLKARLTELYADAVPTSLDDPSIVAWGFCEDDELIAR